MSRIWKAGVTLLAVAIGLMAGLLVSGGETHGARPAPERTFTAYFYKSQEDLPFLGAVLVPVVYPLPADATWADQMRLTFQALCDKPPSGLYSTLLRGCRVISVKTDSEGVLTVDFSGDVFGAQGTSGESMVAEQLRMTASQFEAVRRLRVAYRGGIPSDLGSHGLGNNFEVRSQSAMHLVGSPTRVGERVDTASLSPKSTAVRNATVVLGRPMLGLINRRLSETGHSDKVARQVEYVIPSGDGTLWISVRDEGGIYRVRWNGQQWQVEGLWLP